jgi:nicotinate-nucleotide adenylyltransferase
MTERRIGLMGGTFDPIHRGHLQPLASAAAHLGWERILLIVAARQPFKADRPTTSPLHRWAMAAIATAGKENVFLSDVELERGAISYTVDTLETLSAENPGVALDWVIGDDNLPMLPEWRRVERIFELANFVVLRRSEAPLPEGMKERLVRPGEALPRAGGMIMLDNPEVPVSATAIRQRVRDRQPISDLVEPGVSAYITKYGLYGEEELRERFD